MQSSGCRMFEGVSAIKCSLCNKLEKVNVWLPKQPTIREWFSLNLRLKEKELCMGCRSKGQW